MSEPLRPKMLVDVNEFLRLKDCERELKQCEKDLQQYRDYLHRELCVDCARNFQEPSEESRVDIEK